MVVDGGELPGVPSTVVDLTRYEQDGAWRIVREGAVAAAALEAVLGAGGKRIGDVITTTTATGRQVTWCYATDPDGNIVELQAWS
jgi:hypothetical protein